MDDESFNGSDPIKFYSLRHFHLHKLSFAIPVLDVVSSSSLTLNSQRLHIFSIQSFISYSVSAARKYVRPSSFPFIPRILMLNIYRNFLSNKFASRYSQRLKSMVFLGRLSLLSSKYPRVLSSHKTNQRLNH